jgi:hypothetical protein
MKTEYNQSALNSIIGANLLVDGVYGTKTKIAEDNFLIKLHNIFSKKGFEAKEFQPIGIRMSDSYTDKFSDFLFMKTPNSLFFCPMSTKPASYLESEKAVAVLKEGQYKDTWQYQNTGWTRMPFFQQVKEVSIYRDNFKDLSITRTAPIVKGNFGINIHSSLKWFQNILWYKSTDANVSLSHGCNVCMSQDWSLFLAEINRKYVVGDLITYTLIHIEDFN